MSTATELKKPSVGHMIACLAPGESHAVTQRVSIDDLTGKTLAETVENLRNKVNPAVARAKARTSGTYTVESGDFRTKDYALVICVVVTRTDEAL